MGHKETDTSVVNIMCKKYDKYINVNMDRTTSKRTGGFILNTLTTINMSQYRRFLCQKEHFVPLSFFYIFMTL